MAKIICPNCGTENPENSEICITCAKPLAAAPDKTILSPRAKKKDDAAVPPPPPANVPTATPPPTPPANIPQVPPAPPAQMVGYVQATPLANLGVYSDGWSDVIEGAAPLAEKVKLEFVNNMIAAEIPRLHIAESNFSEKNGEVRNYKVISFGREMTVIVRAAPFGKHLVVSWDMFTKQSINWLTIGILAGAMFVLAFLNHILGGTFLRFFYGLFSWWGTFINWLLVPGLAVMLFGKILKGDWLAFFKKEPGNFAEDDAIAITTIVDDALSNAVEKALEEE